MAPARPTAGDQAPGAAEHGQNGEGDGEPDRPEDEQEDHEGHDRERNQEDVHACVVLQ